MHPHRRGRETIPRPAVYAAAAACCLATISACSSSGSSSATTAAAGASSTANASCVATASSYLAPYSKAPTSLPSTFKPLPRKPTPGGTVIKIINGNIPNDAIDAEELKNAAAAVGWTEKIIVFNGTVEDLVSKFNEAIADKPTVIMGDGLLPSELTTQLAAAKAAGIVVELGFVTTAPTSYPGYAATSFGPATSVARGTLLAYQLMKSSGCSAHVLATELAGYPIETDEVDGFTQTLKAHCPACTVTDVPIQASNIGTPAATSAIVSGLQADPSIKYVYIITGNVDLGLSSALAGAGIDGVTLLGSAPQLTDLKALEAPGATGWWATQNPRIEAWVSFDAVLHAVEAKAPYTSNNDPETMLTAQNVPKNLSAIPAYPANFRDDFKQLWGVG